MAEEVCDKLIYERPWVKYTDISKIPHEEGIYVIGVKKRGQKAIRYLYLGQSIDVHVRLMPCSHQFKQVSLNVVFLNMVL